MTKKTEYAAYKEENKANLPLLLDVEKLKAFQLQGIRSPDPLTIEAMSLDPAQALWPDLQLPSQHTLVSVYTAWLQRAFFPRVSEDSGLYCNC